LISFAQKGVDTWMNVVTACRACNHRKSSRNPEQAGMPLLYTPYVPSLWEDFILRNRRILADQMEFLMAHIPKTSRLHARLTKCVWRYCPEAITPHVIRKVAVVLAGN
jgi:hypothetical protein